jgi:hypothetical protein
LEGLRAAGFGAVPSLGTRTGSAGAEPFSVDIDPDAAVLCEFGIETAVVSCSLTLETPPGWLTY